MIRTSYDICFICSGFFVFVFLFGRRLDFVLWLLEAWERVGLFQPDRHICRSEELGDGGEHSVCVCVWVPAIE